MTIIEIQLTESLEILDPLVDEVCGGHHNDGTARAPNADAVRDRERDEGLSHTNLIGQDLARVVAQTAQNLDHLSTLALLVRFRHSSV